MFASDEIHQKIAINYLERIFFIILLFDFFQFEYDFLQERNKRVSPFSSFQLSNALKCKPEQDFLVPFYPNPLCDWVNALAIFKLPLFPICRDGLLSFLWCRNPWRQQVSPKIVMHSIDSNFTLSSQLEIRYYFILCRAKHFESKFKKYQEILICSHFMRRIKKFDDFSNHYIVWLHQLVIQFEMWSERT